ncbi:MAG: peptidase M48 [Zetaproteobacteria bacterium CG12_big_fil_rev_8_21_14_0_65_54_13]|nr:MAG: peptidase M48 [Zetaproteobacteria bacterium CG12_big_fil_rev_8_21_14_0_65_54_13]PIX54989.1 MAG: peptidase M48 [Zetaproteobacteria bacterium CG_4_10_14_3_um_filter_54_28]PJA28944.1 MAG: peptidase M48 [Zetaproteobacteria bacterium CG_4_9_14_3_um_filter_54_145]
MVDFFGQQEQARRQTKRLVILFSIAVLIIIMAVYLAVTAGLFLAQFFQGQQWFFSVQSLWNPVLFAWVVGLTLLLVGGGSFYRLYQLRQGGGRVVAQMLGGSRIASANSDPLLRRLLNVVEEMAVAAGLPVPPVYMLEQAGINAFAAGFSPADAVIAVTRGAVDLLNRDELQGVIAHEFSHILNGDTRLKMRLLGMLFGITLISDAGILMLSSRHTLSYSSRERGTHPALLAIGFLLFLVGTTGAVFADLIKRAVSRQREFLADAAAVQFTRNPTGIANALKLIGGYKDGSRVTHPAVQQTSHFFFGNAIKGGQSDWWATHPPLIERIRRLDPRFNGQFAPLDVAWRSAGNREEAVTALAGSSVRSQPVERRYQSADAVASVGRMDAASAQGALALLPERLRRFARDPYTARAIVYALLLDADAGMRTHQLDRLREKADAAVFRELLDIQPLIAGLADQLRIPLLELLLPALKELSAAQYPRFKDNVELLIRANQQVSMFEYMLHRMLLKHLAPAFQAVKPVANRQLSNEAVLVDLAVVVAMLVRLGKHVQPAQVYRHAMGQFGEQHELPVMPRSDACSMARLDTALNHLQNAAPLIQQKVITACSEAIVADGRVDAHEREMLRTVCDALGCPMPPLQAGGR